MWNLFTEHFNKRDVALKERSSYAYKNHLDIFKSFFESVFRKSLGSDYQGYYAGGREGNFAHNNFSNSSNSWNKDRSSEFTQSNHGGCGTQNNSCCSSSYQKEASPFGQYKTEPLKSECCHSDKIEVPCKSSAQPHMNANDCDKKGKKP